MHGKSFVYHLYYPLRNVFFLAALVVLAFSPTQNIYSNKFRDVLILGFYPAPRFHILPWAPFGKGMGKLRSAENSVYGVNNVFAASEVGVKFKTVIRGVFDKSREYFGVRAAISVNALLHVADEVKVFISP